jgi:hypothetical protein
MRTIPNAEERTNLMGGSEAMKDGSSCASFLRSPTTVSAAFTADILPALDVTSVRRALHATAGCGKPTVEQTEEAVSVFQHGMQRVVSQLILVVLVSVARPSSRAANAQHHPNTFLGLKENLTVSCQKRHSAQTHAPITAYLSRFFSVDSVAWPGKTRMRET